MSVYRMTSIWLFAGLPLALAAFYFLGNGRLVVGFGILLAYVLVQLICLRCPRCRSSTVTRRFLIGRRGGLFNQYIGGGPPKACQLCGLDLESHRLRDRIPWNGERATRRP